jgi:hypothetical protein
MPETYIEAKMDLRRFCQHRSNSVREENDDLLVDSHNILSRWKKLLLSAIEFSWF